jgi:hypothetical protein
MLLQETLLLLLSITYYINLHELLMFCLFLMSLYSTSQPKMYLQIQNIWLTLQNNVCVWSLYKDDTMACVNIVYSLIFLKIFLVIYNEIHYDNMYSHTAGKSCNLLNRLLYKFLCFAQVISCQKVKSSLLHKDKN